MAEYINKEAAVNALAKIINNSDMPEEWSKGMSAAMSALYRAPAADVREVKWISVEERLPEEEGCYLVAVKNDHKRRYSKTAWFSRESWFARQDVTHWMPLPEPPKEE